MRRFVFLTLAALATGTFLTGDAKAADTRVNATTAVYASSDGVEIEQARYRRGYRGYYRPYRGYYYYGYPRYRSYYRGYYPYSYRYSYYPRYYGYYPRHYYGYYGRGFSIGPGGIYIGW